MRRNISCPFEGGASSLSKMKVQDHLKASSSVFRDLQSIHQELSVFGDAKPEFEAHIELCILNSVQ